MRWFSGDTSTNKNNLLSFISKYSMYSNKTQLNLIKLFNNYELNNINDPKFIDKSDKLEVERFKQWLVGFIDGDGTFRMHVRDNNTRVEFSFSIHIHSDDVKLLERIKYMLDLNNNNIHMDKAANLCVLTTSRMEILLNTIIPIFDKYPLLTKKRYDYKLWREAIMMYVDSSGSDLKERRKEVVLKILDMKNNFNNYDNTLLFPKYEDIVLNYNLYWLIGFIEAEGSFSIKTQKDSVHFIITQREESAPALQLILDNLLNIIPDDNCPIKDEIEPIKNKLYKDGNKDRIIITTLDFIYWCFIPYLLEYNFNSRKFIDFCYWIVIVYAKKHGFLKTYEGQELLNKVKKTINNKRYLTNYVMDLNELLSVLNNPSIFDINNSHKNNYRKIKGRLININDNITKK